MVVALLSGCILPKYCLALKKGATHCGFILHSPTRFTHPSCAVPEKKHWRLFRSFRPAWSCGWQRWTVWSQVSRRWTRCTACKPCLWMLPPTRPTPCTPSVIGKPSYLSISKLSLCCFGTASNCCESEHCLSLYSNCWLFISVSFLASPSRSRPITRLCL